VITYVKIKGEKQMESLKRFLSNCPTTGAGKKYTVLCNGEPFAGANSEKEAKEMIAMYGTEIHVPKKGMAYCSLQAWSYRRV
jgi:hypothetical protein